MWIIGLEGGEEARANILRRSSGGRRGKRRNVVAMLVVVGMLGFGEVDGRGESISMVEFEELRVWVLKCGS